LRIGCEEEGQLAIGYCYLYRKRTIVGAKKRLYIEMKVVFMPDSPNSKKNIDKIICFVLTDVAVPSGPLVVAVALAHLLVEPAVA
jgi:hypothetical protein